MPRPQTLLELSKADLTPASLETATLVLIDMQNEYCTGPLSLPGARAAGVQAKLLLEAARQAKTPVIHIAHKGREGGLFDRSAPRGQIIAALAPQSGEALVEKSLPNAFAATDLAGKIAAEGRPDIIIAGFMTHMCVSSTARAALDHGLRVTIDASACATRDLPDGKGGVIGAVQMHEAALAGLADRFAIIARDHVWG